MSRNWEVKVEEESWIDERRRQYPHLINLGVKMSPVDRTRNISLNVFIYKGKQIGAKIVIIKHNYQGYK